MHKLGVIVPYRNRPNQLKHFLNHIKLYLDKKDIEFREEFVSSFISDENVREYIVETMSEISDIERITSKIALNRASPRELIYLKNSLLSVEDLKLQLRNSDFKNFKSWAKDLPELTTVM